MFLKSSMRLTRCATSGSLVSNSWTLSLNSSNNLLIIKKTGYLATPGLRLCQVKYIPGQFPLLLQWIYLMPYVQSGKAYRLYPVLQNLSAGIIRNSKVLAKSDLRYASENMGIVANPRLLLLVLVCWLKPCNIVIIPAATMVFY